MTQGKRVLVTGAGGFIGHHLTSRLVADGHWVRGVDIKHPEYEPTHAQSFEVLDLRRWSDCLQATREIDEVYNLAANMGGIGFIETNKAEITRDNSLINLHMLEPPASPTRSLRCSDGRAAPRTASPSRIRPRHPPGRRAPRRAA